MIKNFRHKGLKNYWLKKDRSGLNPRWLKRIERILGFLQASQKPNDLNVPGFYFHALSGNDQGRYSVRLTKNYRITFAWQNEDATDIDLEDYH